MACYHPLEAYQSLKPKSNGKSHILFPKAYRGQLGYERISLPCGQCVGCRLERSRQWAIRCLHEAQMHEDNCFLTLTYSDDHLPPAGALRLRDFQLFFKRLRKRFGAGIRFFHCGEYGEQTGRPHYHACIFGFNFADRRFLMFSKSGSRLYSSEVLDELWPYGHANIGEVTFESAAYVARYIMKKVNGHLADEHYSRTDPATGEIVRLPSEYTTMSRRPGIAKGWFNEFFTDVYPHDNVIVNGKKVRPPRYYDTQFEIIDPDEMCRLKETRKLSVEAHADNLTPARLAVRETVLKSKISRLIRS